MGSKERIRRSFRFCGNGRDDASMRYSASGQVSTSLKPFFSTR
jgi:hypothetical protein